METSQKLYHEAELQKLAVIKVKKIKNFYTHLFVFFIGVLVYLMKRYYGIPFNFPLMEFLNSFVMSIWAFFIVLEAISVFMNEIIFGKKWEERKLKELLKTKSKKKLWN